MRIHLDVWSDYVCPFCYLLIPDLDALRSEFGDQLDLTWHAYELRPDPVPTLDPNGHYLHDIWNRSVYPLAAERGMLVQLPPVQPRSRLAHEAAAFARSAGLFDPFHNALFRAFFQHGRDIGQSDVLAEIASSAGLDSHALTEALHHRHHRDAVLADEERAAELGITAVPTIIIHRHGDPAEMALTLAGTQPLSHLRHLLTQILGS